jgi:hypothetical protein
VKAILLATVALVLGLVLLPVVPGEVPPAQAQEAENILSGNCSDGNDNDGDGLFDAADPGCQVSPLELSSVPPSCSDGVDNDGDGIFDAGEADGPDADLTLDCYAGPANGPIPACAFLSTTALLGALLSDIDGDFIDDDIDTGVGQFADGNTALAGSSSGFLFVLDVVDPPCNPVAGVGVLVIGSAAAFGAETIDLSCDGVAFELGGVNAGDSVAVSCGSGMFQVLTGPVQVTVDSLTITIPSSSTVIVTEIEAGVFSVQNALFSSGNVTVNGTTVPRGTSEFFTSVLSVDIDIKPGSDPNSINLSSAGVVPVAILSSATFDATQVDPATVSLAGAKVKLIGKGDKYSCSAQDVNGDGLLDLVCHVVTADFLIETGESVAVLEADTFGGQHIRGEDSIRIVSD